MRVIELFAGIGAPHFALDKTLDDFEMVGVSEIDIKAIEAYRLMHGDVENFGNIKLIKELPQCDFLHFSSPCTSFAPCGKNNGLEGESGLLLEVYRLFESYRDRNELPTYFSFENVVFLLSKFEDVWKDFLKFFDELGYNVYYRALDSSYFNSPQKRERLYAIGILKSKDKGNFIMPYNECQTSLRFKDVIMDDNEVTEEFFQPQERYTDREYLIPSTSADTFRTIRTGHYHTQKSKKLTQSNRIYSTDGLVPTLTTKGVLTFESNGRLRKIHPLECWRLMGFPEEKFNKVKHLSKTALFKICGNSISVPVLEVIYRKLFEAQGENIT